jgi:hypothetical protein
MPWKEVAAVNERMEFVVRLKAGERMSDLCRELPIRMGTDNSNPFSSRSVQGLSSLSIWWMRLLKFEILKQSLSVFQGQPYRAGETGGLVLYDNAQSIVRPSLNALANYETLPQHI